ncbi:TIR domain-containing protein [Nostoc sp. CCY 9925]|uniref:TIR domain-containing protein n=1 Tax=Nostoc sp. CCY 9925 TaxID=3103865 RepID=UPI0039C61F5E
MSFSSGHRQSILFLAANPQNTSRLTIDQELREIGEGLQRAQKRDQFQLEQRLAVRPRDLQRAMLDINPQIIHFSGHGTGEAGLIFEDEIGNAKLVDGEALARLFQLFAEQIRCVVLNRCYSQVQAKAIAKHIDYVIGMNQAISDRAAIEFAVGFYDALGAGRSIEFAYKLGCAAIQMADMPEHLIPVLLNKSTSFDATVQPALDGEYIPSLKRLKAKYEDLEEEWEEVSKKLRFFKKERIIKTDSEAKYELAQRIQEYEAKLKEIEEELQDLEQQINQLPERPKNFDLADIPEQLTPVPLNKSNDADVQSISVMQPPVEHLENAPINVFISYSNKDKDLLDEFIKHLAILERQGKITAWYDSLIKAGEEWKTQIEEQLESAQIILLLISPDFMASDHCYEIEMQQAMARHNQGTAQVIPIILRPSNWIDSPFSMLQVLPKDARPVTQWSDRDTAFLNVVEGIRKALNSL